MSAPLNRMAPARRSVWPMIVANSVDLPTPLRPMTLRHSPGASVSDTPSSTFVAQ